MMPKIPFHFALPAACLQLLLGTAIYAQITVTGRVSDPDGAAVPQTEIRLQRSGSDSIRAVSDAEGEFRLQHLPPGKYAVHVSAENGFDEYSTEITIGNSSTATLQVQLQLASVSQDVTVGPETEKLSLDNADNRDQIHADSKLLEHVPIFDQNYIAALTPFLDQTGLATSGVSIVVDGVEMKGTGVSVSAISEVRINSDPYSSETSRPGRGRIEIITKPGTAQLHGSLNFTFRDSVTDAINYFAVSKPFEQKRIYEGSITGPVPIDQHTMFLLSGSRSEDNLQSIVHAVTPSGLINNNVATPIHDTEFATRITHEFSASHRLSLQYNVSDVVTRNQGVGGLVLGSAGLNTQSREDDVILNDRIIISPSLLNQLQLFYEKDRDPIRSATQKQKMIVDGSFTDGGAQGDILQTENNLKINDIVSWTHKRHYVKFGINIPNLSRRAWEDQSNRLGTYSFASLADYANGTPYSFTQQAGPGRSVFWMNELGTFFQDQIQISRNLQIAIGLRYDWQTYFKSFHDFAPRGSIAYSSNDHKLVLRAGAGLFYDRSGAQPIADLKRYNGFIIRSVTLLNPAISNPFPIGTDISNFPTNLVRLGPGGRIPYITNFSAGVERQLISGVTFAATYRGTVGVAMFRSRDVNAPLPPSYTNRPDPRYGVIRQIESEGRQLGNALDLTLQGKAGRWFSGVAQYSLSRTDNNTGGIMWFPANQYSLSGEYARSDLDQRHRFNLLGTVNEEHWLNLGFAAKLYSGLPYNEMAGVDVFHTGLLNARPNGVARNSLEGSKITELDLRWGKELRLPLKVGDVQSGLAFSVDAFNVTNTTSYMTFVGNVRSAFFEQPTAAMPARRFQFSVHYKF
ncbi:TonB-dependent receptor [Terriglobus saanensis]|uniref:TonB-dependent transporter Oar-like beta-barrel domain-containing protein n=1 Tax=Terriglobus saanensis (strain ATCC BAA-1853 / DSM 23119 / SP1PR4) TaxID=401053 RepID=E8V3K8_TERSS|nr:carboxypeptidase regulatory-like domain-containing protein [Terriglobus saanensis]ADV83621.1 hypothetical protein AciPR4_2853 [Terriglobus saanensis SP1PR4]